MHKTEREGRARSGDLLTDLGNEIANSVFVTVLS